MKRLFLTLTAALALAAPLGVATSASAQHHGGHGGDRGGRGGDHGDRGGGDRGGRWDGRGGDHGGDRGGRWDGRGGGRNWDDRRNNGYWFNNRWFYGPPPESYFSSPFYRPGYSSWRRGGYLPPYYNGWVVNDYWRFQLRRPPAGYHWVRIGGDYLLVSNRNGLIFDIIPGEY
jgi:Ni/Co efflux regulator RcnB